MGAQVLIEETVTETAPEAGTAPIAPPRKVLKAGPVAVEAWKAMRDEAEREAEARERTRLEAEAVAAERALETARKAAERQGVETDRIGERGPVVAARDGLLWLVRKNKLHPAHERAGLKFREDYEVAVSAGLVSSLELEGGRSFGPKLGASEAQMLAKDRVLKALASLGSPMLRPYVVEVAGNGEMLNGKVFVQDPKRSGDHLLPCVIALDMLARHYGMIR